MGGFFFLFFFLFTIYVLLIPGTLTVSPVSLQLCTRNPAPIQMTASFLDSRVRALTIDTPNKIPFQYRERGCAAFTF